MMTAPFSMRDYHLDGVAAPTLPSQITVQATFINDQASRSSSHTQQPHNDKKQYIFKYRK